MGREQLLLVLTLPLDSWSLFAPPVILVGWGEPRSSSTDGIPWDRSSHLDLQSPGPVSADLNLRLAAGLKAGLEKAKKVEKEIFGSQKGRKLLPKAEGHAPCPGRALQEGSSGWRECRAPRRDGSAGRGRNRVWKGPEMPAGLWHFPEFGGLSEWQNGPDWRDGLEAAMSKVQAGYGCWGDCRGHRCLPT